MTQENIEQVIKDKPKIWVEKPEKEKEKGKGKEKETAPKKGKGKEKEKEKQDEKGTDKERVPEKDKGETDKRKASIGEKFPSTTDTGSSPRKKRKGSKPTYHTILHDDDFENIADRVCDSMSRPITMIKTMQEALEQTIETQLTELKTLVSHTPQVATPSTTPSAAIDPKGNHNRFITVTPITIRQPSAQEGLQEGTAQLDLAMLPLETLRTLQAQIAEEFNDKEQLVREKNDVLR